MDLHQLIYDALDQPGEKPPPLRLDDHLRAGRRAVRRRRTRSAVGASVAVTAVVVALTGAATLRPSDPAPGPSFASSGVASPTTPEPAVPTSVIPFPAEYRTDGELVVAPDWQVVQRIDQPVTEPMPIDGDVRRVPDRSVALVVTRGSETRWVLACWLDGGGSWTTSVPAVAGTSLDDWVAAQVPVDGS